MPRKADIQVERGFFEAIRRDPLNPGPVLIYADWLEEAGRGRKARQIRLDIARGRRGDADAWYSPSGDVVPLETASGVAQVVRFDHGTGEAAALDDLGLLMDRTPVGLVVVEWPIFLSVARSRTRLRDARAALSRAWGLDLMSSDAAGVVTRRDLAGLMRGIEALVAARDPGSPGLRYLGLPDITVTDGATRILNGTGAFAGLESLSVREMRGVTRAICALPARLGLRRLALRGWEVTPDSARALALGAAGIAGFQLRIGPGTGAEARAILQESFGDRLGFTWPDDVGPWDS